MRDKHRVYLAGPEVFLPNASDILLQKSEIARESGFVPVAPGDAKIPPCETRFARGVAISVYDEELMRSADAIVANLTPFRGSGADTGTCFELGFMAGLGRHVCAYTNDARSYLQRIRDNPHSPVATDASGEIRTTADSMLVEDFDMIDNLMMHGSVQTRGGVLEVHQANGDETFTDMTGFRKVLKRLADTLR